MIDQWSLRVSVTNKCQLNCGYCLPGNISGPSLSLNQYQNIAESFREIPLKKVRFTGGEPTLRKDLPAIVKTFALALPKVPLAITTNGLNLKLKTLHEAGISQVTIHLDTLRPERFFSLMGGKDITEVFKAIEDAQSLSIPIKINMVVQQGLNDDELHDFLAWSNSLKLRVRFIEMMDTGSAHTFVKQRFISGADILKRIGHQVKSLGRECRSDPEEIFMTEEKIAFGLIASDTRPFCEQCNRARLSASGKLYTCLYEPEGVSLLDVTDLKKQIWQKLANKNSFHPLLAKPRRLFSMSEVGG